MRVYAQAQNGFNIVAFLRVVESTWKIRVVGNSRALQGLRFSADGRTVERRQGLGLPLARQLVEGHGGTLELLSEEGHGTSAIVTLP